MSVPSATQLGTQPSVRRVATNGRPAPQHDVVERRRRIDDYIDYFGSGRSTARAPLDPCGESLLDEAVTR